MEFFLNYFGGEVWVWVH